MRPLPVAAVYMLAMCGSCIVEAPVGSKGSGELSRAVVQNAPPMNVKSGAIFENKVEALGAQVNPGQVMAGGQVKVTLGFRVLEELDQDYMVFVHVEAIDGAGERLNADHRPASGMYPTTQWKKGEMIKDEFPIYIPPSWQARGMSIWFGFWQPQSNVRLKLANPDAVKTDGLDRVLLAQVPVIAPN